MLSRNAKAFMVDNLLGLSDNAEVKEEPPDDQPQQEHQPCTDTVEDFKCPTLQSDRCSHPSSKTIFGIRGLDKISIELCQNELWHSFHHIGTEMIITKSGRRMFPAVRVKLHGLKNSTRYRVSIEFVQLDNKKYRYVYHSSKWMVAGTGDVMIPNQSYKHPDSPLDGSSVQSPLVSFERIKLTNHERPKTGQLSLLSMQRFVPKIKVQELDKNLEVMNEFTASFPQTAFISVTAYQNQEITRLKIARNPFAKGFREAGKSRSSFEAMIESYGFPVNPSDYHMIHANHRGLKRCHSEEESESEDSLQNNQGMRNFLLKFGPNSHRTQPDLLSHQPSDKNWTGTIQLESLIPYARTSSPRNSYSYLLSRLPKTNIFYHHNMHG